MAGEARAASPALAFRERLGKEPWRFGFQSTLRRLECEDLERPRLGESSRISDDPLRLGQEPSMIFAPASLATYSPGGNGGAGRLGVYLFGLFGPNGPLPLHLTEYAQSRLLHHDDPTFVRFLDVFHHRMLCLFYRAWAVSQPTVSFDRPEKDRFGTYVASLFGMGMDSLRDRDALPDLAKLHFAGRLACQTRHPEGLAAFVGTYFLTRVRVREFVGQWITLPPANRCRMGESPTTGTLGESIIVGARIWDFRQKFRLIMGPMGWEQFTRLLPGGESLPRLVAMVRTYIGDELSWEMNPILKREEVPKTKLGSLGQVGLTTWLITEEAQRDADDLVLTPMDHIDN